MGGNFIKSFFAVSKIDWNPLVIMIVHIHSSLTGFKHRHTITGTQLAREI